MTILTVAIDWQQILVAVFTTVGGGAVLLGAAAYLIKTALTQRLVLDAEVFKAQLKASADAEIERLRHSLQMAATEHEVRFSKLHEKRAEVIAEYYKRLVEVSRIARQYSTKDRDYPNSTRDDISEVFNDTGDKVRDLSQFAEINKIYLPTHCQELLRNFFSAVRMSTTKGAHSYRSTRKPYEFDAFNHDIEEAKQFLEAEFRMMLGETSRDHHG